MITLLLLIPIIGSLILLFIPETSTSVAIQQAGGAGASGSVIGGNQIKMKKIALITSLLNLFVSLFIWFQFDSNQTQYQFVSEFNQLNFCLLYIF